VSLTACNIPCFYGNIRNMSESRFENVLRTLFDYYGDYEQDGRILGLTAAAENAGGGLTRQRGVVRELSEDTLAWVAAAGTTAPDTARPDFSAELKDGPR
jgi:hypothetical protein